MVVKVLHHHPDNVYCNSVFSTPSYILCALQVYYKRGDVPDLRPYETRLLDIRCKC